MGQKEIIEDFQNGKLKILNDENDTFNFSCKQCGMCCCNNDDIIVSPWDVVRMSYALKKPAAFVGIATLKFHIGSNTHIPVATLDMKQIPGSPIAFCPLLSIDPKKPGTMKCSVQRDKPFNCAVFPLGRMTQIDKKSGTKEVKWFAQEVTCSADTSHPISLKDWLALYNIEGSQEAADDFTKFIDDASKIINLELISDNTDNGVDNEKKQYLLRALTSTLYGSYNPDYSRTLDAVAETKKVLANALGLLQKAVDLEPALKSNTP